MVSLGCAKNLVDAEIALGALLGKNFELAVDPRLADIVLINTCGFIESAREEAYGVIDEYVELKREKRGALKVVAMGCLAQRRRGDLLTRHPELDAVWGLGVLSDIDRAVSQLLSCGDSDPSGHDDLRRHPCGGPRLVSTPISFSYLKIADGCDNRCRYCSIPDIRGAMRSRDPDDLLTEARILEARGSSELVLIAQDTTVYGRDLDRGDISLATLLERLLATTSFPRIRVLYAHPAHLDERVRGLLLSETRLCRYLDLPLQHVSDSMLRAMGRGYGWERVHELVDAFSAAKDFTLRSTLLTGFPGESEADFLEMLDLVRSGAFRHLGAFAYSPEAGTPAFALPDRVPGEEAERRRDALLDAQQHIAFSWLDSRVGNTEDVLVDKMLGGGWHEGRTASEAPDADGVVLVNGKTRPGTLVSACITGRDGYDLIAGIAETGNGKMAGKGRGHRRGRR
ncbi:MAG: 30S ribosomal protein S12 methylthiotransferase RimO [Planctomycetota bacterium]|nr:30S ribosomal protein S12 methylthiotransferase RimO [Planctomycetota bacterium]